MIIVGLEEDEIMMEEIAEVETVRGTTIKKMVIVERRRVTIEMMDEGPEMKKVDEIKLRRQ